MMLKFNQNKLLDVSRVKKKSNVTSVTLILILHRSSTKYSSLKNRLWIAFLVLREFNRIHKFLFPRIPTELIFYYIEKGATTWYLLSDWSINLVNLSRPNPERREKIKLNFYFYTSLRCLKRIFEGPKCLHKTFWGTTKKYENKNFT